MAILERIKTIFIHSSPEREILIRGESSASILTKRPPLKPFFKRKGTMRVADYLDARLIAFLDVGVRDAAIDELIDLLWKEGKLPDQKAFRAAIIHREQLVSTGIGMGVALPHAKLAQLDDFFIAIGIQRKKGIEWNALDKAPVRLIFLIGGPDNRQAEYLQILSQLTTAIKDVELRKEMLQAESAQEVLALLEKY